MQTSCSSFRAAAARVNGESVAATVLGFFGSFIAACRRGDPSVRGLALRDTTGCDLGPLSERLVGCLLELAQPAIAKWQGPYLRHRRRLAWSCAWCTGPDFREASESRHDCGLHLLAIPFLTCFFFA